MNNPMSQIFYICLNVVIFTSAVYILLTALFQADAREETVIRDMGERASVTMQNADVKETKTYVQKDSQVVYHDILSLINTIPEDTLTATEIVINGRTILDTEIQKIKEKDPESVKRLKDAVNARSEYRAIYEYDDELQLIRVEFEGV